MANVRCFIVLFICFLASCASRYTIDNSWRDKAAKMDKTVALKNIQELLVETDGQTGFCNSDGAHGTSNPVILSWSGPTLEFSDNVAHIKNLSLSGTMSTFEYEDNLITKTTNFNTVKWLRHYTTEVFPKASKCFPLPGTKTFHIGVKKDWGIMVNVTEKNVEKLIVSVLAFSPNIPVLEGSGL